MEIISDTKNSELVRFGHYFLGLINDLKRRPEDAAKELNVPSEDIMDIIEGRKEISLRPSIISIISSTDILSSFAASSGRRFRSFINPRK